MLNKSKSGSARQAFPKGIYGITDPDLLLGDALFEGVESALKGGCAVIQYRNKKACFSQQRLEAQELVKLCKSYEAFFIINDNLELALDVNADGVHLGKSDGDIGMARRTLGADKYLGVTCHSDLDYAKKAIDLGVDYCAFGRFFPSNTKPNAPHSPLSLIPDILQLPIPTLAIGGITVDNMPQLMDTHLNSKDFNNVAVIHSLFGQPDIEQAARHLSKTFFSFS